MENIWQDIIFTPIGGFIVVFFGTMLLFAEVLVRGRFILGLLGLATASLYFMPHVQDGHALWMAGIYILGILLVVLDGKVIGDGTIAAIGLILMVFALAIPSPSILYGAAVVTAFIIGAFGSLLFLKFLPKRRVWSKLALHDALTSEQGYNSINEEFRALDGKEGIADTDFRPAGTISINGRKYSALSEGQWIKKGTRLLVSNVDGTRILVRKVEEQ
jgi:membrane-bound ClpP family serine protease